VPQASPRTVDTVPRPARVEPTRLSVLAALARGRVTGSDVPVTGITASSDRVRTGDVFAALSGRSGHGARFAPAALASGAVAVLTDPVGAALVPGGVPVAVVDDVRSSLGLVSAEVYGRPSAGLAVLGITGTSGKTTTTFLVRAGLAGAGVPSGLIGTVATMIGDEAVKTGFTTPEAPDVQALLAVMRERGARAVAMEVSSHALAMGRADGIAFAVGAFTNLSQDHLDFHADMDDYFEAKARLFDGRSRTSVIVVDDEWGRRLAARVGPDAVTVSTTGDPDATWRASEIRATPDGSTVFVAAGPGVETMAGCRVPGGYNVANALLALAILHTEGVPAELAASAVAGASVPGRMERVDAGQSFLAVVDYSHKPAAVEGALRALRPLTEGRLVIVLGCGGDRDRAKRPVMGEVAARGADLLIVTDDNPRSEDPAAIRRSMLAGAVAVPAGQRGDVREIGDRAAAIESAVAAAGPHDTVLVAGKGHETGQEVAGVVHPFADSDVLRRAIEEHVR
jgi:UDP-N-acetylmuramoyl-L-alanyl-D-glutamate--2,6-diaminopimelate ligase